VPLITAPARQLTCAGCGAAFECAQSGECWCAAESYRVPMPASANDDCLCPACLRQLAASSARKGA